MVTKKGLRKLTKFCLHGIYTDMRRHRLSHDKAVDMYHRASAILEDEWEKARDNANIESE